MPSEAVHTNIMGEPKSPEEKRGSASDSIMGEPKSPEEKRGSASDSKHRNRR
jgi:hypothetical protein